MSEARYVGEELPIFARATHWKEYVRHLLCCLIRGRVLEVGAGLGATAEALWNMDVSSWLCLEPDRALADQCAARLRRALDGVHVETVVGSVVDLPADRSFDTILYVDVLEHIEHDHEELTRVAAHLAPNGTLIVLSPAYQWLFSEFDRAVGHYRRYTRSTLAAAFPPTVQRNRVLYADSFGAFLSLANRLLLRRSAPTLRQILFWDRVVVPISRIADRMIGHSFGRCVIAIYQRPSTLVSASEIREGPN